MWYGARGAESEDCRHLVVVGILEQSSELGLRRVSAAWTHTLMFGKYSGVGLGGAGLGVGDGSG